MKVIDERHHGHLSLIEDTLINARVHGDVMSELPITIVVTAKAHAIHGRIYAPLGTVMLKGGWFRTLTVYNGVTARHVEIKGKVDVIGTVTILK